MTTYHPLGPAVLLRRSPGLAARDMDGRTVMMDTRRGSYFALDPVGSAVWDLLAKPASVEQLVAHIAQSFGAPDPAALRRDLREFLGEMLAEGLVEMVPVP
jgi:Coenzyme PQQ synthesis protein D (PqqD)